MLYDTGWKDQDDLTTTNTIHWAPIATQLAQLGIRPEDVTKIVIGNAHRDRAGQIDEFPNAILYVQKAELEAIELALNYPNDRIRSVNSSPGGCLRTPACEYSPRVLEQIYRKVLQGKAVLVDGQMTIGPGLTIHPAHGAHTRGSRFSRLILPIGKLLFGGGAFSSWEGIRDWMIANLQQTHTVQQFLAYEQCYKITGGYQNCVAGYRASFIHR